MKTYKLGISVFIFAFLISPLFNSVRSQSGVYGPVINATTFEYVIEPGQSITDSFQLRHDYQDPNFSATFYPTPVDFTSNGVTGEPVFLDKTRTKPKSSLEDWVKPLQRSVNIDQLGEMVNIDFEINIPQDAEPGSYYAALLLSDSEFDPTAGPNQIALKSRLGPLIFVTVPGNIVSDLTVLSFEAVDIDGNAPFLGIFEYQPVDFKLNLKNDGNVFMVPGGSITVHQGDLAKPIYVIQNLNETKGAVLAGTTRTYTNSWNDGTFRIIKEQSTESQSTTYRVDFRPEHLNKIRIGRFTSTLQLFYRDKATGENIRLDYDISFWIIPWKFILLVISLIVGYFYAKRFIKNSINKKVKSKSTKRNIE